MGAQRNFEIAKWQEHAGLNLPSARSADLLRQMSDKAFELIKVIELEISGIRDGDSCWSGSDPVGGIVRDLVTVIEQWEVAERPQALLENKISTDEIETKMADVDDLFF
jgi:hypothetical protein